MIAPSNIDLTAPRLYPGPASAAHAIQAISTATGRELQMIDADNAYIYGYTIPTSTFLLEFTTYADDEQDELITLSASLSHRADLPAIRRLDFTCDAFLNPTKMRTLNERLSKKAYPAPSATYFVLSHAVSADGTRHYNVRKISDSGEIEAVKDSAEFSSYISRDAAHRSARRAARDDWQAYTDLLTAEPAQQ